MSSFTFFALILVSNAPFLVTLIKVGQLAYLLYFEHLAFFGQLKLSLVELIIVVIVVMTEVIAIVGPFEQPFAWLTLLLELI